MPFFASRHTSQASNASVQRRKGQSFARNTTSNKKKRERREEKRREEKRREEKRREEKAHSASFHVFFFGETKELETKREKQRERERVREKTSSPKTSERVFIIGRRRSPRREEAFLDIKTLPSRTTRILKKN